MLQEYSALMHLQSYRQRRLRFCQKVSLNDRSPIAVHIEMYCCLTKQYIWVHISG